MAKRKKRYQVSDLVQSGILFDEAEHVYTDEMGALSGVTSILGSVLFPDKYSGIPKRILDSAAERGTAIHKACQAEGLVQEVDKSILSEVMGYKRLKSEHKLSMIASEYLVGDPLMRYASSIDLVDEDLNLYDIKTTRELDEGYVSWQLSFYADLFESQNPTLKAGKLYAIWLRGEVAELREVARKSKEEISRVIGAWKRGEEISQEEHGVVHDDEDLPQLLTVESQIVSFKKAIVEQERIREEVLSRMKARMEEGGIKRIESDRLSVTLIPESVVQRVDSKRLEADHPELVKAYMKESVRRSYVRISLK